MIFFHPAYVNFDNEPEEDREKRQRNIKRMTQFYFLSFLCFLIFIVVICLPHEWNLSSLAVYTLLGSAASFAVGLIFWMKSYD